MRPYGVTSLARSEKRSGEIAYFVDRSLFSYFPKLHSYALKIKCSFINYFQRIFILTYGK